MILAGRAVNDYMPRHVAEMAIKGLNDAGKVIKGLQGADHGAYVQGECALIHGCLLLPVSRS